MSDIVDEINLVIKNEKIEELCGNQYIDVSISVRKIDKNKNIEESFKEYIKTNDDISHIEYVDEYEIEEIKYWATDLSDIIRDTKAVDDNIENIKRVNKLTDMLKENKIKAYRLVNPKNDDGIVEEYLYLEDGVTGCIRCYENENERFIISFVGSD